MWRVAVLSLLLVGSVAAQINPNRLPPGLVSYLELTQSQQEQIIQANTSFNNFNAQKLRRSSVVQAEIQDELSKPDPDAMALGLRYRELESIRRETAAEQTRTLQTVQTLLSAAQKLKLATLQEALRLQSTACDAVNWNLTTAPLQGPILVGSGGLVPVSVAGLFGGSCGTLAVRTGDFTFTPGLR